MTYVLATLPENSGVSLTRRLMMIVQEEAIMRRKRRYEGTKLNKKDRCAVPSCAKRLKHVGFDCRCGLQYVRPVSVESESTL